MEVWRCSRHSDCSLVAVLGVPGDEVEGCHHEEEVRV